MNFPPSRPMSAELQRLIERTRNYVMTPEEVFEQRVSFVYGQQDYDNPNPRSKDEIRESLIKLYGRPPCPKCGGDNPPTNPREE